MAGMAVLVQKTENVSGSLLLKLKNLLGISLTEIKVQFSEGHLFYWEIYTNDYPEIAKTILSFVSLLNTEDIQFSIHETENKDEAINNSESTKIDEEVMRNILDSASEYE